MNCESYDIAIIGAGHVGSLSALALAQLGYKIALIDAKPPEARHTITEDNRVFALTYGTQCLLNAWGIWETLQANTTPIKHIHVSRQNRFGALRMHANSYDLPELGTMCAANVLQTTLNTLVAKTNHLTTIAPASLTAFKETSEGITLILSNGQQLTAKKLIGADGVTSSVRSFAGIDTTSKPFYQHAIVANVTLEKDHNHTAYERFTHKGVLALLPHELRQMVMILSTDDENAKHFMSLNDKDFLQTLQGLIGKRVGPFTSMTKRMAYPLTQHLASTCMKENCFLLGDAYVRLHPVAAQGFNLAVRHIALFIQCLQKNSFHTFQQEADNDTKRTLEFTNSLTRTLPLMGVALHILDHIPAVKRHLLKGTMKGARYVAWQS